MLVGKLFIVVLSTTLVHSQENLDQLKENARDFLRSVESWKYNLTTINLPNVSQTFKFFFLMARLQ